MAVFETTILVARSCRQKPGKNGGNGKSRTCFKERLIPEDVRSELWKSRRLLDASRLSSIYWSVESVHTNCYAYLQLCLHHHVALGNNLCSSMSFQQTRIQFRIFLRTEGWSRPQNSYHLFCPYFAHIWLRTLRPCDSLPPKFHFFFLFAKLSYYFTLNVIEVNCGF